LFYLFADGGSVLEEDGVDRVENEVLRIRCGAWGIQAGKGDEMEKQDWRT
jgi:hypothetical protein